MGISDISGGKYTRNFRAGSSRNRHDITNLIRIYPWLEDVRIGFMTNRQEETIDGDIHFLLIRLSHTFYQMSTLHAILSKQT